MLTEDQLPGFVADVVADRRLALLFDANLMERADPVFYSRLSAIAASLMAANGFVLEKLIEAFWCFSRRYQLDLNAFSATSQFPVNRGAEPPHEREYDAMLLLSPLLNWHRYRIFEALFHGVVPASRAAFVGCGLGARLSTS